MFFLRLLSFLFFFNALVVSDAIAISPEELFEKAQTLEDNGFLEEATESWECLRS